MPLPTFPWEEDKEDHLMYICIIINSGIVYLLPRLINTYDHGAGLHLLQFQMSE